MKLFTDAKVLNILKDIIDLLQIIQLYNS